MKKEKTLMKPIQLNDIYIYISFDVKRRKVFCYSCWPWLCPINVLLLEIGTSSIIINSMDSLYKMLLQPRLNIKA